MTEKRKKLYLTFFVYTALVAGLFTTIVLIGNIRPWERAKKYPVEFQESARELDNPNRGFYYIYDFWITDEQTDYQQTVDDRYQEDVDTELTMIQICLQDYREGEITEAGLKNIEALFDALDTVDKQLIVRFLYDREGKNLQYEPQNIQIILRHMQQMEAVLREHSSQIFTLQGLFIGNWGEMHGTRYESREDICTLAWQLAGVTDESTYLAVRTPVQRRMILQQAEGTEEDITLKDRIGLFNDGMLGNETDYGTYESNGSKNKGIHSKWSRKEELDYQNETCDRVPNGGEVIIPNVYNDIDNAIADMRDMHVTYLNREYDGSVFEKWTESLVNEKGIFNGMDGCTYVERHLGYRIFIDKVEFIEVYWQKYLRADITLKNVGFAPMYKEPDISLVLCSEEGEEIARQKISDNLCELPGGNVPAGTKTINGEIDLNPLAKGMYKLYLEITDPSTGKHIQLANVQDESDHGYLVGKFEYK